MPDDYYTKLRDLKRREASILSEFHAVAARYDPFAHRRRGGLDCGVVSRVADRLLKVRREMGRLRYPTFHYDDPIEEGIFIGRLFSQHPHIGYLYWTHSSSERDLSPERDEVSKPRTWEVRYPPLRRKDLDSQQQEAVGNSIGEMEQLFEQGEYAIVSKKLKEFFGGHSGELKEVTVRTPDGELERRIENLEERLNGIFDGRIEVLRKEVNRGEISRPDAERRYREEIEFLMPYGSVLYGRFHYVKERCVYLRDAIWELSWEGRKEKRKARDGKWSGAENADDKRAGDAEAAVQGAHRREAFAGKIKEYLFMDVRELWGKLREKEITP